jgi:hypothetical protein
MDGAQDTVNSPDGSIKVQIFLSFFSLLKSCSLFFILWLLLGEGNLLWRCGIIHRTS